MGKEIKISSIEKGPRFQCEKKHPPTLGDRREPDDCPDPCLPSVNYFILKMKQQQHDINLRRTRKKKSESQMGFEPTTLRDLVGCSHLGLGFFSESSSN